MLFDVSVVCLSVSDVPAWAFEVAAVHPYDPAWPAQAEVECTRLSELLAPWLVDGVEHVGSTAVCGLAAKPIIDLAASVTDPDAVVAHVSESLAGDGWYYVPPELDQRDWRRFFVKTDSTGQRRVAHLHLIRSGHPRWTAQIAFRDALRADIRLAQNYQELKQQAARQHGHDREAYTNAKTQFIAETLHNTAGTNAS